METIGQPINKDSFPENSQGFDLRTLDELLRLAEIRLYELEKRVSYLEGRGRDAQFIEVVRVS